LVTGAVLLSKLTDSGPARRLQSRELLRNGRSPHSSICDPRPYSEL
jgi:hypothetical protein